MFYSLIPGTQVFAEECVNFYLDTSLFAPWIFLTQNLQVPGYSLAICKNGALKFKIPFSNRGSVSWHSNKTQALLVDCSGRVHTTGFSEKNKSKLL